MKSNLLRTIFQRFLIGFLVLLATSAVLFSSTSLNAQGETPTPPRPQGDLQALTSALVQSGVTISYHAQTGKVRFIGVPSSSQAIQQPSTLTAQAQPEDAARGFLSTYGPLFGLQDQTRELTPMRVQAAGRERSFVRFQQVYNDVPVFGGELIVQMNSANNILSANGEILPDIALSTSPAVTAAAASQTAVDEVARWYAVSVDDLAVSTPELWIYNPALVEPWTGESRLVWRMNVTTVDLGLIRELVLVDAQRGSIALHFNQIDTALSQETYTANNGTSLPGTFICDETDPTCAAGDSHAQAAHKYAADTYNFYLNNHGRDSIDNAGMTIISTVHYDVNYANAGWNGQQMIYGDAHGYPLADDVVAHELTHGVTERELNLFYYYQSGAINESLSDVWGEFVDLTNGAGDDSAGVRWLMGEDIDGLGAIRNMADPPAFGDPDRITSINYYTFASDNGGVHTNSGVNNKAASLMVDGGTFNGQTVTGLGIPKVAKIYYEVQTNLLTSGADYADLHDALYQGCLNLVGTDGITAGDCQEVLDATNAVEMDQQPMVEFNTDAALCPADTHVDTTLFLDDLEAGSQNWTFGAATGTNRWSYDWPYTAYYGIFAHSGTHFLYADDYPATTSDSFAAMNLSVSLPADAYLHFAHAYDLASDDFATLEYSTDNGSSWNDASSLIEVNDYDTVDGFTGSSHGYISSRVNLTSLAGESVRFRWRMVLDIGSYVWGWWLDDVQINTCALDAPGDFNKSGPNDGAIELPTDWGLSWSASSDATDYEYCYDTTDDDACSAWTSSGGATSTVLTGLAPNTTYYWQVRAVNTSGTTYADGSSTDYWSFTTSSSCVSMAPGDTVSGSIGTPLQTDCYQFTGSAGTVRSLAVVTSGTLQLSWQVLHADGSPVAGCMTSYTQKDCTLDSGGDYTVLVSDGSGPKQAATRSAFCG